MVDISSIFFAALPPVLAGLVGGALSALLSGHFNVKAKKIDASEAREALLFSEVGKLNDRLTKEIERVQSDSIETIERLEKRLVAIAEDNERLRRERVQAGHDLRAEKSRADAAIELLSRREADLAECRAARKQDLATIAALERRVGVLEEQVRELGESPRNGKQ